MTLHDIDAVIQEAARELPSGTKVRDEAGRLLRELSRRSDFAPWVDNIIAEVIHDRLRMHLRSQRAKDMHKRRRDVTPNAPLVVSEKMRELVQRRNR